jgi:uncharacterized membrane-anchored protein
MNEGTREGMGGNGRDAGSPASVPSAGAAAVGATAAVASPEPARRWRYVLLVIGLLLLLGGYDRAILMNERLLAQGTVVRLELAPRDPRALLAGDYMALNYRLANEVAARENVVRPGWWPRGRSGEASADDRDGCAIVRLDARGVAQLVRVQPAPQPREAGEIALAYRVREGALKFGTNAWFFEEGTAKRWEPARFGEFRVGDDGRMLLVAMLDEAGQRLGP